MSIYLDNFFVLTCLAHGTTALTREIHHDDFMQEINSAAIKGKLKCIINRDERLEEMRGLVQAHYPNHDTAGKLKAILESGKSFKAVPPLMKGDVAYFSQKSYDDFRYFVVEVMNR